MPLLAGKFGARHGPHEWLGFELGGSRALRREDWKGVWMPPPFGAGEWHLYRIDRDPAELWNRAEREPEELAELVALWEEYARANGVELPEPAAAEPVAATGSP